MNYKKNFYLLIAGALLVGACQKGSQPVDPGLQFKIAIDQNALQMAAESKHNIKRDDPATGPEVQIQTSNPENVTRLSKDLTCGPVRFTSKPVTSPDLGKFHFRVSENEFTGINGLPVRAPCTLTVTIENQVGSKSIRDLAVPLHFDGVQTTPVTRMLLNRKKYQFINGSFEAERYYITNTFAYPLGVTYYFNRYLFSSPSQSTLNSSYPAKIEKFDIEGSYQIIQYTPTTASIKIPPGQSVVIKGYTLEPAQSAQNPDKSFYIFFDDPSKIAHSLSLFESFEMSPVDLTDKYLYYIPLTNFRWF